MIPKDFHIINEYPDESPRHKDDFIHVHSIGIWSCEEDNMIRSSTDDYLLTYLSKGTMYFKAEDGSIVPTEAGKVVIYRPGEPQYLFKTSQHEHMRYWVHFTGYGVQKIFDYLNFGDRNIFNVGISTEVEELFMSIIDEVQITNFGYEVVASAKISALIALVARLDFCRGITGEKNPILPALEYMHHNYSLNKSVDFFASLCMMSKYYFIRTFKKNTDMTPVEYLKMLRITKAIDLLEQTNLKVSEISEMVGYADPLYFSRLFKKIKGISPTEYRNRM